MRLFKTTLFRPRRTSRSSTLSSTRALKTLVSHVVADGRQWGIADGKQGVPLPIDAVMTRVVSSRLERCLSTHHSRRVINRNECPLLTVPSSLPRAMSGRPRVYLERINTPRKRVIRAHQGNRMIGITKKREQTNKKRADIPERSHHAIGTKEKVGEALQAA